MFTTFFVKIIFLYLIDENSECVVAVTHSNLVRIIYLFYFQFTTFFLVRRTVRKMEAENLAGSSDNCFGMYLEVSYHDEDAVQTVFSTAVTTAFAEKSANTSKSKRKRREAPLKDVYDVTNLENPSEYTR